MAEYLSEIRPTQRTKIIRDARFPRREQPHAYSRIRGHMGRLLTDGKGQLPSLNLAIDRFEAEAESLVGQERAELRRCAKALRLFTSLYTTSRLGRFTFGGGKALVQSLHGLSLKTSLVATISEASAAGETYLGGCAVITASDDGTGTFDMRLRRTAGLILWGLETESQQKPLPRLCMAIDVLGSRIMRAPPTYERFREDVNDAAQTIVREWPKVSPPHGYDGPDPG